MQTLENWKEWKERCALALCAEEARRLLPGFVHARFSRFVEAYVRTTNAESASGVIPSAAETWHRFETHFRLHDLPGGKAYKDWLFTQMADRGYSAQESVEAGVTVLLRDVVREYLRREYSSRLMVSTNNDVGANAGDGGALTLEELLPGNLDTTRDVVDRELAEIARADSAAAFAGLARRERIALLVHEAGLSLAHPEALKTAGCGRSALNDAFHDALASIAAHARERHPREDKTTQASLACLIFAEVRRRVCSWGRSENDCARVCKLMEAQDDA